VLPITLRILAAAATSASAISCPDKSPDANTNSLTLYRWSARLSRKLYRICLSFVSRVQFLCPTKGSHSSSGVPRPK